MNSSIESFVIDVARSKRLKQKMTQAELAELLGVTPGFIGKVESPRHNAKYNLNHINKLALIFDCSPQAFLPKEHQAS